MIDGRLRSFLRYSVAAAVHVLLPMIAAGHVVWNFIALLHFSRASGVSLSRNSDAGREGIEHGFRSEISSNRLRFYSFADGRLLVLSAVGKSAGIGIDTFPVAAHSVPRCSVVMKPTHSIEYSACPIGV